MTANFLELLRFLIGLDVRACGSVLLWFNSVLILSVLEFRQKIGPATVLSVLEFRIILSIFGYFGCLFRVLSVMFRVFSVIRYKSN